jgi:hypothetical protein
MDVASDSSSSTLSITFSEDSTAKRAEAAMEDFGKKLAAAKQASQGSTQDSEEELIQLEYGSSTKRSTSQLISMIDNTEVSPLTGTQGYGFMGYGDSSLQQPTMSRHILPAVPAPNVQATGNVQDSDEKKVATGKKKRQKKYHPLEPALAAMKYEHTKGRIIFGDEENPDKKGDVGPFKVAQFAITGSHENGNYKKWELDKLKSEQLRQLAMNIGCTRVGSISKYLVRKEIALRIDLGTIYDQVNMPNVRTTTDEKNLTLC